MFESLKHWFDDLDNKNELFDHTDDEAVHVALASVLYHIIKADAYETHKEKHRFEEILCDEFDLSNNQISELYRYVRTLNSNLRTDLNTLNEHLQDKPTLRFSLMNRLNQLIAIDGVESKELAIFYDAMNVFFPNLTETKSEF